MFNKILKQAAQLAVMSMLATSAVAADWPTRTVKIITNLPVGSRPDVVFRLTAEELSAKWKQPVVVENRPGGSGAIALGEFDREAALNDHLILAVDSGAVITMPILNNREDLVKNIQPIATSYYADMVVVASTKFNTTEAVIAEFRKRPIFGSWAVGSIGHFCGLDLSAIMSSQPAEHVAYKEYGVWYTDLHNQAFPLSCSSYGSASAMIESGKLRVIATATDKRNPKMPQVPTVRELTGGDVTTGYLGYLGYFVHARLDQKIANKIESSLIEASKSAAVIKGIESGHGMPAARPGSEFAKHLAAAKKSTITTIQKHNVKVN
jgi:tripartite-type tricarboxylate transporter receptor subunit TctC